MNVRAFAWMLCFLAAAVFLGVNSRSVSQARAQKAASDPSTIEIPGMYDPDPNHFWNRLYRQFHVRVGRDGKEYGYDELDPLLWPETEYLLKGPSHEQAIRLLDEFLSTHAEHLVTDPLKRALLQHDLWAVFDWSADAQYKEYRAEKQLQSRSLQRRLAEVIKRLALTDNQIRALPDNYSEAIRSKAFPTEPDPSGPSATFLPPNLFQPDGSWVCLFARGASPVAPNHTRFFGGRSVFLVFIKLPAGREATLAYLERLRTFPEPWALNPRREMHFLGQNWGTTAPIIPNPDLPKFPDGTELALVRQMVLIDEQGELTPTRITESVQFRSPSVYEFRLSPARLFAQESGGLQAVTGETKGWRVLNSLPIDLFEARTKDVPVGFSILDSCNRCHGSFGVQSFFSFILPLSPLQQSPPDLVASTPNEEARITLYWKRSQYDWGLLQGFWRTGE